MTRAADSRIAQARADEASEDALLAQSWRQGDQRAAECLIRRHFPALHAFIASRATAAHEAEDLTQEVFAAVSRQIAMYRPEVPFAAWIHGIARNKIADAWRRHRPTEVLEARHEGIDERSPAQLHEAAESAATAWKEVFAKLPEPQATALWLRVQEELPLEAIAAALGVTLANAKVLLFRARQTLANHWKSRSPS
jgi:RNA polymerase sigma-70 factor, ECF subfamily